MHRVEVPLGKRSYPILIGKGLLSDLGKECKRLQQSPRCAVIADEQVAPLYGEQVMRSLRGTGFKPVLITIPAGETSKNLKIVQQCYEQLARQRLERKSFVVALGGGITGDLAGFVAATYLRGIGFVQVPTTLLAQVDSSVGGKVGVNLRAGKNLVGAFYQPRLVLCDLGTFRTLPKRELRAGLAEVIKYGVIYDAPFFHRLEREIPKLLKLDLKAMPGVVARCCQIKAEVVGQDERESGLRAILNFGHTIGHAIEAVSGYNLYLHGEALAIGMAGACWLSERLLGFPAEEARRVTAMLSTAGLPVRLQAGRLQVARLLNAMQLDKKVSQGEVTFVLAEKIGKVRWGQKVPQEMIEQAVRALSLPGKQRG